MRFSEMLVARAVAYSSLCKGVSKNNDEEHGHKNKNLNLIKIVEACSQNTSDALFSEVVPFNLNETYRQSRFNEF